MNNMYYSRSELKDLGVDCRGNHCQISKKSSFYSNHGITIEDYVRIDDFCVFVGNIHLGNHVHIGSHCGLHASGNGTIIFDDFSGISSNVQIYASSDNFNGEYLTWRPGLPENLFKSISSVILLKKYSQIGTASVLLPGGSLGEGTAVGAMSLIKTELEPWAIYAGIPCRFISERKSIFLNYL